MLILWGWILLLQLFLPRPSIFSDPMSFVSLVFFISFNGVKWLFCTLFLLPMVFPCIPWFRIDNEPSSAEDGWINWSHINELWNLLFLPVLVDVLSMEASLLVSSNADTCILLEWLLLGSSGNVVCCGYYININIYVYLQDDILEHHCLTFWLAYNPVGVAFLSSAVWVEPLTLLVKLL